MIERHLNRAIAITLLIGIGLGWSTASWAWTAKRWEDGSAKYGWTDTSTGSFIGLQVDPDGR